MSCKCENFVLNNDMGYYVCMDCGLISLDKKEEYDNIEFSEGFRQYNDKYYITEMRFSNKFKNVFNIHRLRNNNVRSHWYYWNILRVDMVCSCGKTLYKGSIRQHLASNIHAQTLYFKENPKLLIHFSKQKKKQKKKIKYKYEKTKYKINNIYENNKEYIKKRNLEYYYKTRKSKVLEKVECKCGRKVSKGNLPAHTQSKIHHRLLSLRKK